MDKSKIINDILSEWALRSPDGLASGPDTIENASILHEILAEKTEINPLSSKYFEKKGAKLVAKSHPLYNDGTSYDMIKSGQASLRWKAPNSEEQKWTKTFLTTQKGFLEKYVDGILKAIEYLSKEEQSDFFKNHLDMENIESAISYLNVKKDNPDFSKFLTALDKAKASAAGNGENILVLLIKGAKTMGSKSGDILLPDGKKVDVKEKTDDKDEIRVSLAAFGPGRFEKIPYIKDLSELIVNCRNPEIADGLKTLVKEAKLEDKGGSSKRLNEYTEVIEFIDNPSMIRLNSSVISGLQTLRLHILELNREEYAKQTGTNKVEFDIRNTTDLLAIKKMDADQINKIKNPNPEGSEVSITVSPIEDTARQMEIIIPRIKRLGFFKYDPKKTATYDPISVADEMFDVLSSGEGSYTGGIITVERRGFSYESNLRNWHGQYYFSSYAQTGPVLKRIKSTSSL